MIGETVLLEGWLQKVRDEVTYYQGNYSSNYERLEGEEEVSCNSNPLIGLVTTSGDKIILAKELKEMLHDAEWKVKRNKFLSAGIVYHVSDNKMSWDELTENHIKQVFGDPDADYGHHCSDLTGYLWTDESFVVNDHDLIKELWSHFGSKFDYETDDLKKWFAMQITFYQSDEKDA
jgi:hypothetical protein